MDMNRIRLQNFKKEVEVLQKKLEFEENSLKQRIDGVEMREKQVREWCECLELQRREITERVKAVEVCEKRLAEGFERVKAVDAEEARVSQRLKAVEEREKEVEKRRRVVEEKEVEVKERRKAVNEMSKMLVSKEKRIRECEEEMELKKKEIDGLRENSLNEVELRENSLNQRIKEVEIREEQINEKISEIQMNNRCRELDAREKMLIKLRKVLTSSAQVKTRELQPVECSEIQLLCKNMDAKGLRSYLIKHYNYIDMMLAKISDSLQLSPDPAKLALNVIQSLYELVESKIMPRQMYIAICIALSGVLMKLQTSITLHVKDDVMKFGIRWRDFFAKQGYSHFCDTFAFLQFLAAYKLAQSYDADEILSLLGTFYIKSEGRYLDIGRSSCRILGLEKENPGFIQSLITREEKLRAIVYICVFKLEDAFPSVPPLEAHLECIQKRVQEMVSKGSDKAQNDAVKMELSALRALLSCMSNFKLESSFSPAPLELHIKQLEKDMEGKVNAENVLTVKKNLADSENKGFALPGFDQSHVAVGKKRSLNSMVFQNQGKCFKSRKKAGDARFKKTTSETDVEYTDEEENEDGKKMENRITDRSDDEKSEQSESDDIKDMSRDDSEEDAPKEKAGLGKAKPETKKKTPSVEFSGKAKPETKKKKTPRVESTGKAASKIVVTPKEARLVPKGITSKTIVRLMMAMREKSQRQRGAKENDRRAKDREVSGFREICYKGKP